MFWTVKRICRVLSVNRASFYAWKKRQIAPTDRTKKRLANIQLFIDFHNKYPSHGYRWLNAKIKLEKGIVFSDNYAQRCCYYAGIKSQSKHYRYKEPGEERKVYPNLVLQNLKLSGPMQCIVSDMTMIRINDEIYEWTIYMDLWNNEIVTYSLSSKKGDRMTYIKGLEDLLEIKKEYPELETILHTDQGSVYSSKSYNELLPLYNIKRSMSRAGTPTDNGAMEAINGWIKAEIYTDFNVKEVENVPEFISNYVKFFNEERPAYALNYLTPKQFKNIYA